MKLKTTFRTILRYIELVQVMYQLCRSYQSGFTDSFVQICKRIEGKTSKKKVAVMEKELERILAEASQKQMDKVEADEIWQRFTTTHYVPLNVFERDKWINKAGDYLIKQQVWSDFPQFRTSSLPCSGRVRMRADAGAPVPSSTAVGSCCCYCCFHSVRHSGLTSANKEVQLPTFLVNNNNNNSAAYSEKWIAS